MREKVLLFVVGLLLGASLSTPAGAHHYYDNQRLRSRVSSLESKVRNLESKTRHINSSGEIDAAYVERPYSCFSGDTAVWTYFGIGC